MRRSILIVMLDVMVLSVLALTSGQRNGGANPNIPIPMYRWSAMIQEGLRKEQDFHDQLALLEAQLAEATDLAKQALGQAELAQTDAGRERAGNLEMQAKLRESELAAEKARSRAAVAERESELAAEKGAELERREADARARADEAIALARVAEADAQAAEQRALVAAHVSESLEKEMEHVSQLQETMKLSAADATRQLGELEVLLSVRNEELQAAKSAENIARERVLVATEERERLKVKSDVVGEELSRLREKMAVLEVQKEAEVEKVAELEEVQREAEAERSQSIWIRRDQALRRLNISYTEYYARDDRSLESRREIIMPLVQVGASVLIPADFKSLGLNSSFWSGLSDYITGVRGALSPVADQEALVLPIRSIIVPGVEPQVCFVHFAGEVEGAIQSISMAALKEQRLKSALLFSPSEVSEHGRVEISPVVGSDYLKVRTASGKKPKVGDYLMSDRGEFIGIMVTKQDCYVTPQALSRTPEPIAIPFTTKDESEAYYSEFVRQLKAARTRVKEHLSVRKL